MGTTDQAITNPVVVIQRGHTAPAVKFYATNHVAVLTGRRKGWDYRYPEGGNFSFPKGYSSVHCEMLPRSLSDTLARRGTFPSGGGLDPDRVAIIQLRNGERLGIHWDVTNQAIGHTLGHTLIVARYRSWSTMAQLLTAIGVPNGDLETVINEVYKHFVATGR